jgi:UDP-glucose 4-epimerase
MVVPTFIRQAVDGQPITVFGAGDQQRCFCQVHDAVAALAELAMRDDVYGEVFNIGSTEEVSMLDLAERIKRASGSESEIVRIPYTEAYGEGFEDMQRRVPDTTKISATIGWRPRYSLDRIVDELVSDAHNAVSNGGSNRAMLGAA